MTRRLLTLLLVTFTALILELALIRWIGGQVRIVAYFPNLVLIGAFFGMGLGCLRQGRRPLFWLMPLGLLTLVLAAWAGSGIAFTAKDTSEFFWLLYYNLPREAPVVNNLYLPLLGVFLGATLVFIPLGQQVADILAECQANDRTLLGYAFDLGGSLLGVIAFTLLSMWGTFPLTWFAVGLLPGILVVGRRWSRQAVYLVSGMLVLLVIYKAEFADEYSPYYALNYQPMETEDEPPLLQRIIVSTNGSMHQAMVGIQTETAPNDLYGQQVRKGFNEPFQYLAEPPRTALVLGAGTGNDVATLLGQGVESIDAVEIDRAILEAGKRLHPDQPYQSPKVTAYTGDARSYLNNCRKKYDLIMFGTLDSMTRLSALSNVRLDNFVYTKESLQAARNLLTDRGGILLNFMVGDAHIDWHITSLISEVFGEFPMLIRHQNGLFNRSFMAGPAFSHVYPEQRAFLLENYHMVSSQSASTTPTDDWPYLYLNGRQISGFYLKVMAMILATSLGLLFLLTLDRGPGRAVLRSFDLPMFLFGAAFLILNTKSVTEIGLVWGNTWMTNSITFASVLLVLLLSTLYFAWRPLPLNACFIGLFASLVIVYLFPLQFLLGMDPVVKLLCTIPFIGLPFFFAGACFAGVFKSSRDVPAALGWNVIGALCGGLLENLNMLLGFKALYLLALIFYLVAYMAFQRRVASAGVR